jgi:predicted Fe-Mo cluster-binding NifX family protein
MSGTGKSSVIRASWTLDERRLAEMKVCIPIAAGGQVDPRWGRADRVAVAEVADGQVSDWQEFAVGWGTLHDQGTEGAHHARIARFLRDNQIQVIAAHHVGPGMERMLSSMAIRLVTGADGDARAAALAAVSRA